MTIVTWRWLPQWLAEVYNARAFNLNKCLEASERDNRASVQHLVKNPGHLRAEVLRNYQRAVALDPTLWVAYSNTGKVLESFYRYEAAEEQYRSSILAERADTADLTPYSNLARALVRDGKPLDALRVIADAERLPKGDGTVEAALARNKAWAEYELGFYTAAARDASRSDSAAGNCILAEAYKRLGRTAAFQNRNFTVSRINPVVFALTCFPNRIN